ncbi:IPT/TIG domain containing protein [Balamuthia mandrillaris]
MDNKGGLRDRDKPMRPFWLELAQQQQQRPPPRGSLEEFATCALSSSSSPSSATSSASFSTLPQMQGRAALPSPHELSSSSFNHLHSRRVLDRETTANLKVKDEEEEAEEGECGTPLVRRTAAPTLSSASNMLLPPTRNDEASEVEDEREEEEREQEEQTGSMHNNKTQTRTRRGRAMSETAAKRRKRISSVDSPSSPPPFEEGSGSSGGEENHHNHNHNHDNGKSSPSLSSSRPLSPSHHLYSSVMGLGPPSSSSTSQNSLEGLNIRIAVQPPLKTVYQRILKPFPAVALIYPPDEDQPVNLSGYFVEATLLRGDNGTPIPQCLDGSCIVRFERTTWGDPCGVYATFKKLKILSTSQQLQGTLLRLKFTLKRYSGSSFATMNEVPNCSVISHPIEVFSHTQYLNKKTPKARSSGPKRHKKPSDSAVMELVHQFHKTEDVPNSDNNDHSSRSRSRRRSLSTTTPASPSFNNNNSNNNALPSASQYPSSSSSSSSSAIVATTVSNPTFVSSFGSFPSRNNITNSSSLPPFHPQQQQQPLGNERVSSAKRTSTTVASSTRDTSSNLPSPSTSLPSSAPSTTTNDNNVPASSAAANNVIASLVQVLQTFKQHGGSKDVVLRWVDHVFSSDTPSLNDLKVSVLNEEDSLHHVQHNKDRENERLLRQNDVQRATDYINTSTNHNDSDKRAPLVQQHKEAATARPSTQPQPPPQHQQQPKTRSGNKRSRTRVTSSTTLITSDGVQTTTSVTSAAGDKFAATGSNGGELYAHTDATRSPQDSGLALSPSVTSSKRTKVEEQGTEEKKKKGWSKLEALAYTSISSLCQELNEYSDDGERNDSKIRTGPVVLPPLMDFDKGPQQQHLHQHLQYLTSYPSNKDNASQQHTTKLTFTTMNDNNGYNLPTTTDAPVTSSASMLTPASIQPAAFLDPSSTSDEMNRHRHNTRLRLQTEGKLVPLKLPSPPATNHQHSSEDEAFLLQALFSELQNNRITWAEFRQHLQKSVGQTRAGEILQSLQQDKLSCPEWLRRIIITAEEEQSRDASSLRPPPKRSSLSANSGYESDSNESSTPAESNNPSFDKSAFPSSSLSSHLPLPSVTNVPVSPHHPPKLMTTTPNNNTTNNNQSVIILPPLEASTLQSYHHHPHHLHFHTPQQQQQHSLSSVIVGGSNSEDGNLRLPPPSSLVEEASPASSSSTSQIQSPTCHRHHHRRHHRRRRHPHPSVSAATTTTTITHRCNG